MSAQPHLLISQLGKSWITVSSLLTLTFTVVLCTVGPSISAASGIIFACQPGKNA